MYEHYYRLTAKPFQLSPDPRFFFSSRGHKRALSYLRYGLKQGEGFIVVTGDVGTGKTTLVGALFQTLAKENVVGTQVVTTQMGASDLLRMVAAGFGVPYERATKAKLVRGLEEFFRGCARDGRRALLVVDEAQGLPRAAIEELRMLSNFQHNGRSLLQTFLLGQREFRNTMRSESFEQLRQRIIAAYHLQPLDDMETRAYIEHRMTRAGWQNDPSFDDDVFDGIYRFTRGVPRRINTLCDRLLLFCYLEEQHRVDMHALHTVTRDIVEEHGMPEGAQAPAPTHDDVPFVPEEPAAPPSADAAEADLSMASVNAAMHEEIVRLRKTLAEREREEVESGPPDDIHKD